MRTLAQHGSALLAITPLLLVMGLMLAYHMLELSGLLKR